MLPEDGEGEGGGTVVNIYIEGDYIGDETYLENLMERISEMVEGNETRLVASETRAT
jgi:hypothetical protein